MGKQWYSVAISAALLGCGGSTEVAGNASSGNSGGSGNIDSGVPVATGGMMIAYYGPRLTGGSSAILPPSGGSTSNCPATEPAVGTSCSGNLSCNYWRALDCAYPCGAGCTLSSSGATMSGFTMYSVCSNGVWALQSNGSCPTSAQCVCADAGNPDRNSQLTASCEASGGKVITAECCTSTADFPRTCNSTGACGCGPGYTKPTLQCACPSGCFDGTRCTL